MPWLLFLVEVYFLSDYIGGEAADAHRSRTNPSHSKIILQAILCITSTKFTLNPSNICQLFTKLYFGLSGRDDFILDLCIAAENGNTFKKICRMSMHGLPF